MPNSRGIGPNNTSPGCCRGNNTGYCTTRKYDPSGNQLWTADFGIDTVDVALDSTNKAHVVGPRVKDITIQNTRNGGGGMNAVQTIFGVQCDPGSQFRVSLDGYRTDLLDWDCTAADLQTALEALGNIGSGNVAVSRIFRSLRSCSRDFPSTRSGTVRIPHIRSRRTATIRPA